MHCFVKCKLGAFSQILDKTHSAQQTLGQHLLKFGSAEGQQAA
jgi:hypothetical protein